MGTRYKPQTNGKIENLEDVNEALHDIVEAQKELKVIDAEASAQILKIKEEALKKGEAKRKLIDEKVVKIQTFAEYNKPELFKDLKSITLAFGTFGFRKSTKISVKKTTVAAIKDFVSNLRASLSTLKTDEEKQNVNDQIASAENCIRVKEDANKEALGLMTDSFLKSVGAKRTVEDVFFCEPKEDKPNEEAVKAAV